MGSTLQRERVAHTFSDERDTATLPLFANRIVGEIFPDLTTAAVVSEPRQKT